MALEQAGTGGEGTAIPGDSDLVVDPDQLLEVLRRSEKPTHQFRIGTETERFGFHVPSGTPLSYDAKHATLPVLERLIERFGWQPWRETPTGPLIALKRDLAAITLEPAAQLELSGAPLPDLHAIARETEEHLEELRAVGEPDGFAWVGLGFQPSATLADLSWVPKRRYALMREYLPTRGGRALDMMCRTSAIQVNFDFESEADAMQKLMVTLRLAPVFVGLTANSPYYEGVSRGALSERSGVWLDMDPDRSGLIEPLWAHSAPTYQNYVDWALDTPMFLFTRGERVFKNTGQTFRSYVKEGFSGERATIGDFKLHLNTLFPETRLKNTLEVRCFDSQTGPLATAIPALLTGLLYDETSLREAGDYVESWSFAAVEQARIGVSRDGLQTQLEGRPLREHAQWLVDLARRGLERRANLNRAGESEAVYLKPFDEILASGKTPAERLLAENGVSVQAARLVQSLAG